MEGAGIWTWVDYGALGYADYTEFADAKANMQATYESEPATTATVDAVSDDIPSLHVARVYVVLGAAYNTGVLTLTIPAKDSTVYTGTLGFNAGALVSINGVAL